MIDVDIQSRDILVVDKSFDAKDGSRDVTRASQEILRFPRIVFQGGKWIIMHVEEHDSLPVK